MTSTPTRPVDNVITTKGLQERNINILDGTTVENKGKLILSIYFQFLLNSNTEFLNISVDNLNLSKTLTIYYLLQNYINFVNYKLGTLEFAHIHCNEFLYKSII